MEDLIEIKVKVNAKQLTAIAKILSKDDKSIIKGSDINVSSKSADDGGESGRGNN